MTHIWLLPLLIIVTTVVLSYPMGRYLAWIMDGRYRVPRWLGWIEARLDTGAQNWKQYAVALLLFNTLMFVFGFALLALQPLLRLNPDGKKMLAPTTIFNTAVSFLTNTNLQHYAGEQHLSYFSQLTVILWNMFVSAAVGLLRPGRHHPRPARRRPHGQLLPSICGGLSSTYFCRPAS